MGFALAEEVAERGAQVTLVSGPVNLKLKNESIKRVDVISAQEMFDALIKEYESCNIAILSAAVADYRPLAQQKTNQILVGFALETNNEKENAIKKLINKNLDFIVLNSLQNEGAGFAFDTNKISILDKNNKTTDFELKSKTDVATDIIDYIVTKL